MKPLSDRIAAVRLQTTGQNPTISTLITNGDNYAEDHSLPLVRHPGRRGRQLLHLSFQEREEGQDAAQRRRRPRPVGSVLTASFELEGLEFTALNAGPHFKFNEAISFVVDCKDQDEVDYFWDKLSEGGEKSQCGWLKDKFGLSWQITPTVLIELMSDPDREKAGRVTQAMLKMSKIDIAALERAYAG
jgi:predicted 3-demethylubiquinone-9 3-methyltransferase (glyoxalase superfamily)